ncbi:TauD/TfdA family dioxygenase [Pleionea litopenaei]|uniref:TauD/TfdA family dioxygenase n=1 Tax=Pleionea litopenaei TaxID=3070815 RepID=A0AA51RTF3_9GAMM|nr:TauD/TfdA family dioxygenase [Pleionea sp. HL-JVS1]WMS87333.1 TauD/TfdA family dioxygenase [Pleionea sp. HL-JVS1]
MFTISLEEIPGLPVVKPGEKYEGIDHSSFYRSIASEISPIIEQYGGVLMRGFKIDSEAAFQDFMSAIPEQQLDYIDGNSPRTKLIGKVYTSTEYPKEYELSMHNELSYSNNWPKMLYFCCVTEPLEGGHTLIADCRKVLKELDPDLVDKFAKNKVKYTRYLHGGFGLGSSWQKTFEVSSKDEAEQCCKDLDIDFEWDDDDGLMISQIGPGVARHRTTNELVWFNQADQFHLYNLPDEIQEGILALTEGDKRKYPTYAYFGNGEEIDTRLLKEVRSVFKKNTIVFPWKKGDLMIIDNQLMAHGRSPFNCERKILVSMT